MTDPFDKDNAPLTEPESVIAGHYAVWRRELQFDSLSVRAEYRFTPISGGAAQTLVGTTDDGGETWSFELSGSDTVTWVTGEYRWELFAVRLSDSERSLQYTGVIKVHADSESRLSHAEIMIRKIDSILENRADADVDSYSIKSRSITKMSVKELLHWRDYYNAEIRRTGGSENSGDTPRSGKVRVRFVS